MREIKLRAWDKVRNVMVYNFAYSELDDEVQYFVSAENGEVTIGAYDKSGDWYELDVMQFTGLLDKNGKEIYEGDIVIRAYQKCEVKFLLGAFGILTSKGFEPIGTLKQVSIIDGKVNKIEVIGNIYETPELLK